MRKAIKKLPVGTIGSLQAYIVFKLKERGFADENIHERLLLLVEEIGELVNAVRHSTGMNVDKKKKARNELGEEVADIINLIFAVGIELGLDIEKEYIAKEKKIDQRIYKRSK